MKKDVSLIWTETRTLSLCDRTTVRRTSTERWVGIGKEWIWGKWGEEVSTLYEILKELTK